MPILDSTERLTEISAILAAGLLRLSERKSSQISRREAETPLDCGAAPEGHVRKKREDVSP
jgi:hypothetical protein